MKPGDKVWVFAEERIVSFIFDKFEKDGAMYGHIEGCTDIVIVPPFSSPIFESREALCEHYRKIFE